MVLLLIEEQREFSHHTGDTLCTRGFPNLLTPIRTPFPRSTGETRIIPEMNISCSGVLSGWTAVGNTRSGSTFPTLKVFREIITNSLTYSFVGQVELGKCGSGSAQTTGNNSYTCSLNEEEWISTQPNDIIGMFLPLQPDSAFELHFISSTSAPVNYIFMMEDVSSNASIAGLPIIKNIPQINLEITPGTSDARSLCYYLCYHNLSTTHAQITLLL